MTASIDDAASVVPAQHLVPAAHEFRVPGSAEWLTLDAVKAQGVNLRLVSGSREFLTSPGVLWPARLVVVTCPICGGRGVDAEFVICGGCHGRRVVTIMEALADG